MREIELDLFTDMMKIYRETDAQCNFKAAGFFQMIQTEGAITTAKEIINNSEVTEGFIKLAECNRLDLSLEALVIQDKYKELFTPKERKICINRLKKHGYKEILK
ncbi:hypothetical protein H9660_05865 [Clostridium sp. Sa3CUN1]|uniref:Uncharacterized protein n=1 Tax=Clostridium gallinarum TaxID=2762246 RepID=A0ABR8Q2M6_9CLOT|nr:hypothetical protein [Clostridium gallinarum]MBD7914667.1 hypothetical protein [Clostridium gallinarum]